MTATMIRPELSRDAAANARLGLHLLKQGLAKEAVPQFRRFLDQHPDCADTWNNLGVALYEVDDFPGAVDCYRHALVLNPDFAGAHVNLGNALRECGCLREAVECFRLALMLRLDLAEAHCNLGSLFRDLGQLEAQFSLHRPTTCRNSKHNRPFALPAGVC